MASYGGGIVCVFIVLCLAVPSLATVYNVGESSGWTVGVDYTNWTSGKTFMVGDSLVFNYGSGHTVDEVSGSDYNTCTVGNSIKTDNSGITTLLLNTAGTHYYICGVIGHCGNGMKLAVTVADGGVTEAPSESPSSTTTALPPPVTFTSPPGSVLPQPSKSVTLSPFVAVVTAWVAFFKFVLL